MKANDRKRILLIVMTLVLTIPCVSLGCGDEEIAAPSHDGSTYTLTIVKAGNPGNGAIQGFPGGIQCETTCEVTVLKGTRVTLIASPDEGSEFTSWTGACHGTGTQCTVTIDSDKTVIAPFEERHTVSAYYGC